MVFEYSGVEDEAPLVGQQRIAGARLFGQRQHAPGGKEHARPAILEHQRIISRALVRVVFDQRADLGVRIEVVWHGKPVRGCGECYFINCVARPYSQRRTCWRYAA